MEERQRQIREGAGLEESRLNVEFIEALKKYSTPILVAIALIAGGYYVWTNYHKQRERSGDDALSQLDAAIESRNPTTLVRVADENPRGVVPEIARLAAADLHLDASRTGLPVGTTLDPQNPDTLPEGTEPLTDEQRAEQVTKAKALYQQVFDATKDSPNRVVHTLPALFGLAACAESSGEWDAAKAYYDQIAQRAGAANLAPMAALAEHQKRTVEDIQNAPKLLSRAELPAAAAALTPTATPLQNMRMRAADGTEFDVGADGTTVKVEQAPAVPVEVTPTAPPETPGNP